MIIQLKPINIYFYEVGNGERRGEEIDKEI